MQLEHIPDAVDTDKDQITRAVVVLKQKLHEHVETASTDKHLQRQGRSLVHLPHESGRLEPDFVRVLPRRKLGDDRDATDEAQVLLYLDIVEDDLMMARQIVQTLKLSCQRRETYRVDDL